MFLDCPFPSAALHEVVAAKETADPKKQPRQVFQYVDIASVCKVRHAITEPRVITSQTAPSRARNVIRANDVLFATTRPNLKGIAIVPSSLNEQFCSTGFCVLRATDNVHPTWLFYCVLSDFFIAQITPRMRGANYPAVSDADVLEAQIPLPPIEEQFRIADRITECFSQVDDLEDLIGHQSRDLTELKRSLVLGESSKQTPWDEVGHIVEWCKEAESVSRSAYYQFAGIRSFGQGLFLREKRRGDEFSYSTLRRLRKGDFIFPKLMAWEGAFAMVTEEYDGTVVSPEFVVFRPSTPDVSSEVLDTYFRSPICLDDVQRASTGSNKRRRRLNPTAFLKLKMPIPDSERRRQLSAVYEFERNSQELWSKRRDEVGDLREAILRKAFAGEL